jgi:hypothetical protein
VADLPQFLTLKRNRDGRERLELATLRTFFSALLLLALVALLNAFGQRPKNRGCDCCSSPSR